MQGGTLQSKLSRFLFRYRITPHSTTGISPAEMLFGKRLRSQLDLIRPDIAGKVEKKQSNMVAQGPGQVVRAFQVGEKVYARDYRLGLGKLCSIFSLKCYSWILTKVAIILSNLLYYSQVLTYYSHVKKT